MTNLTTKQKKAKERMKKRTVVKLDSFSWGFFIWRIYWGVGKNERPESVDTWGTLVTFFFIPVVWRYQNQ